MYPLSQELKNLNADTYRAEVHEKIDHEGQKKDWESFFRDILLAPDFRIIRASGKVQDKEAMIEQIRGDKSLYRRELVGEPEGYEEGELGVVISVVRLPDDPVNQRDRFNNIKVFILQANRWKCIYWQVTRLPGE